MIEVLLTPATLNQLNLTMGVVMCAVGNREDRTVCLRDNVVIQVTSSNDEPVRSRQTALELAPNPAG